MRIRNPQFQEDGRINCEVDHPLHGWIPYTVSPTDTAGQEIWQALQLRDDIAPYAPPAPTADDVTAERTRRLMAGGTFEVEGHDPLVRLLGDAETRANLDTLAIKAQVLEGRGQADTLTQYRDADNIVHRLTQSQILDLWSQAGAYAEAVYAASWALKDDGEIPADFANGRYWP